jgi:hypothetical protein
MFEIRLLRSGLLKEEPFCDRAYDEALDDYRSVLADICRIIQDTELVKFHVSGFGEDNWSVDCKVDLLGIIEQIPEIIRKIINNCFNFDLDFYEQGVERELVFEERHDAIYVSCKSRTRWKPNPEKIVMDKAEIKYIFFKLYREFFDIAHVICKNLLLHPLMENFIIELPA